MKKLFIFVLLVLLTSIQLYAGTTGKIAGVIKDSQTGEALPGVNVYIENAPLGAATDVDGYYAILNIPPGNYNIHFTYVGYRETILSDVRVKIDLTTTLDVALEEETLELSEAVVVMATRPIVEKDVAGSVSNLDFEEIESLPVAEISEVVALQAGIEGNSIRGGLSSEVAYVMDGVNLRDERNNKPYTGMSFTSVEEIQVQAGGFNAEFGNIRSGVVNVVTKEGSKNNYDFAFIGRYRGAAPKHFGQSPNSANSYWLRPLLDDDVAWTGTKNGAWDEHTKRQYPDFDGFNEISRKTLADDDPDNDLTPLAAQQLALWEHRRQLDIEKPDYNVDMSFGGPVPFISEKLGGLRFHTSYRQSQDMYLVPLSDDAGREYNWQMKITSDLGPGKKLIISGLLGRETGTSNNTSGGSGLFGANLFKSNGAFAFSNFSFGQGALYGTDYWSKSTVDFKSLGLKYSEAVSSKTFYEATVNVFSSEYNTAPGTARNTDLIKGFGNNYLVDEAPFGFEYGISQSLTGMRMGGAFATARDSSVVSKYSGKFDISSQINRFNNVKAGAEFNYTDSYIRYARRSVLSASDLYTTWHRNPIRAAVYIQDKLEFEGMIAQLGVRLDYSHAGGDWFSNYNVYDDAFSATHSAGIDTALSKSNTPHIFTISPRIAVSFPVGENSKIYFNYGHFRQLPQPEDLYLLRYGSTGQVNRISDPSNPLPKTVAYELGYEHNLFGQYLLRSAAYYKDISLESQSIRYIGSSSDPVDYTVSEPKKYRDIRGFELSLRKNRGNWVRGFVNYTYMVSTSGVFGFDKHYENPSDQRLFEAEERALRASKQKKPLPRPYARVSLDFFTPLDYGPNIAGIKPLDKWRLNLLATWKSGQYKTWTGPGGVAPGVASNIQWRDTYNFNIRLSKQFNFEMVDLEFFMDISNVFNTKRLSSTGFSDSRDSDDYFASLHLPSSPDYPNIVGDDKPGDYRKNGVDFVPIVAGNNYFSIGTPNSKDLYYFHNAVEGVHGTGYYRYTETGTWEKESQSRVDKILKDKAYIDMPNFHYFTFINPRNIFFGLKLSFKL